MKTKDFLVTLLICIAIILLGVGQIISVKDQKEQYQILSDKIDNVASQSNTNMADVHSRMDAIEEQIETVVEMQDKNSNSINSIKKSLRLQVDHLNEKIEEVRAAKAQKKEQEQQQAQQTAMVASATIIKTDHSTMTEIDNTPVVQEQNPVPSGAHLTPEGGVFYFGNQLETYYNLDMSVIVQVAHSNGIGGEYWVREDGCKMLGNYIMLACNRDVHPYGSIVQTSLGAGISLDTGGFAANNPYQVDIATNW